MVLAIMTRGKGTWYLCYYSAIPRGLSLSTGMRKREVEAILFVFKEITLLTQKLDTWQQLPARVARNR